MNSLKPLVLSLCLLAPGAWAEKSNEISQQSGSTEGAAYKETHPRKINRDFDEKMKEIDKTRESDPGSYSDMKFPPEAIAARVRSIRPAEKRAEVQKAFLEAMALRKFGMENRENNREAARNAFLQIPGKFDIIEEYHPGLAKGLAKFSIPTQYLDKVMGSGPSGSPGRIPGGDRSPGRDPLQDHVQRIADRYKGDPDIANRAGKYFGENGEHQKASEYHRRGARLEPGNPVHHANLANSLQRLTPDSWQEAWEAGNKAISMSYQDPALIATMRTLQQRRLSDGTFRGADNQIMGSESASAFRDFSSRDQGAASLSRSPETFKLSAKDEMSNAMHFFDKGNLAEAEKYVESSLQKNPRNATGWLLRAQIASKQDRFRDAIAAYKQALRYAPERDRAKLHLKIANLELRGSRFSDAIASASTALSLTRDPAVLAEGHAAKSWAFAGLGDAQNSREEMRKAAQYDAKYARYHDRLMNLGDDDLLALFAGAPIKQKEEKTQAASNEGFLETFKAKKGFLWLALAAGICFLGLGIVRAFSDSFKDTIRRKLSASAAPRIETDSEFAGMAGAEPGQRAREELLGGAHRIEGQIGAGGMGIVYKAHDTHLDRPVAVKKMRDEIRSDPRERERFLKEARTVAGLRNPNIVEIYQILEQGNDVYLVFEYVSGKTISELIYERKKMDLADSLAVIRGVAAALDFAHKKNVIHRDLKPSNVMIDENGDVKVMDFGVARQAKESVSRMSMTNTVVGTPPYMAPEQEQGMVRKESDVFALAVCLYEMVTGELPYRGVGAGMLMAKMNQTYAPASKIVPGLTPEFDAVMAKGLDPDPDKRWTTAGEFLRAVESLPIAS